MKLKYAFNLGRVFTLSLAELFAVFENMEISFRLVDLYREVLIIETEEALEVAKLQKRLGGTIKIMSVIDALPRKKIQGPYHVFHDYFDIKILRDKILATTSGKLQVGVSMYPMAAGLPLRGEIKRLGLLIKDVLVKAGHSTRIVFPQMDGLSLPSVVVAGEHLLEKAPRSASSSASRGSTSRRPCLFKISRITGDATTSVPCARRRSGCFRRKLRK